MGLGQWEKAETLLVRARETAAAEGDGATELSVCSELLGFYRMWGRREPFETVYERTAELLRQVDPGPVSRGTILINAATALVAFGRTAEAMPLYRQAQECYRRAVPAGDFRIAALCNNMASAHQTMGEYALAEELIQKAVAVLKGLAHHPDVATSYVNLAQLYAAQDTADPRIGECLDAAMAALDDPEAVWDGYYAHTARKCAGGFAALGRGEQARELEERAALIYEGT